MSIADELTKLQNEVTYWYALARDYELELDQLIQANLKLCHIIDQMKGEV